jgi:hypothetical protein
MSRAVKAAAWSYAKVFAATVLALFLADGADVFAVDVNDLRAWLAAGIAAILPVMISALDPRDHRYGVGYEGADGGAVE